MFTAIFYMNVKEYTRLINLISVEASRDVVPNMFRLVNFMKLIVTDLHVLFRWRLALLTCTTEAWLI